MMQRMPSPSDDWPLRTGPQLLERQARGSLCVATAAEFRARVAASGLKAAYRAIDVVVAADAVFTDQGSLLLSLGPAEPPIRLRELQLGGVAALVGGGSADLSFPIGGGLVEPLRRSGAQLLTALLSGERLPLSALGEGTHLQPRLELGGSLGLAQIGMARLLLHRGIAENGLVAVSSAEGLLRTSYGPLLGPLASALYSCGGAGSIGLCMPGLGLLGPGSPVLVGGGVGWVVGSGSGHNPASRRQPSGHALIPGAAAAVAVDLEALRPEWVRSCFFEGHGTGLMIPIAAPVPLLNPALARQAATGPAELEAPVLDLAIPRRIKPCLGSVSYGQLQQGHFQLDGRTIRCAPAHSPRLAAAAAHELVAQLIDGRFPLQLPLRPLSDRAGWIPLET